MSEIPRLREKWQAQLVVVNAENAAEDGLGLTVDQYFELRSAGADVVTTGNHVWESEGLLDLLDSEDRLLRPDNYPRDLPGKGWCIVDGPDWSALVLNLQGRLRMANIDDPFFRARDLIQKHRAQFQFCDFHAEASEEKEAFGYWLDGWVTGIVGTHTHVATADERILPSGTAYISDVGMCGPSASVIGGDPAVSVQRALTMLPLRSTVVDGPAILRGAVVEADVQTGRAIKVLRWEQ